MSNWKYISLESNCLKFLQTSNNFWVYSGSNRNHITTVNQPSTVYGLSFAMPSGDRNSSAEEKYSVYDEGREDRDGNTAYKIHYIITGRRSVVFTFTQPFFIRFCILHFRSCNTRDANFGTHFDHKPFTVLDERDAITRHDDSSVNKTRVVTAIFFHSLIIRKYLL